MNNISPARWKLTAQEQHILRRLETLTLFSWLDPGRFAENIREIKAFAALRDRKEG